MRVEEYLRFRADLEGVPRREVGSSIDSVCEQCLIDDVRHQVAGTLSKGYRQRVGLAGALVHSPPVLILDEPTVGLDPNQIIKVRELIANLGKERTVILCSHILPEVEHVCDRVLIIDHGRIVADGAPDELRARLVGGPMLRLELRDAGPEDIRALEALDGVIAVSDGGGGRLRVEHRPGEDLREAVFRLAVERGRVLVELTQEQASLEEVFVRLTTSDTAAPPAEADAAGEV